MNRAWGLVVAGLLTLVPSSVWASTLTQPSIQQVTQNLELALESQNTQGLAQYLSEDVKITIELTLNGQSQTNVYDKQQYQQSLDEAWPFIDSYTYQRENERIQIDESTGRAYVSANVIETMVIGGRPINSVAEEIMVMEVINDRPQITEVYSKATLSSGQ